MQSKFPFEENQEKERKKNQAVFSYPFMELYTNQEAGGGGT